MGWYIGPRLSQVSEGNTKIDLAIWGGDLVFFFRGFVSPPVAVYASYVSLPIVQFLTGFGTGG